MSPIAFAQDELQPISFYDAQKNPALLNPVDDQLSEATAFQMDLQNRLPPANPSNGHSQSRQVEVVYGQQREEEAGLNLHAEGSQATERRIKRLSPEAEAQNRRREEEKERRRFEREAAERRMLIAQAVERDRIIVRQKARLEREAKQCSDWSAGRSGDEVVGRQIIGLWKSSRPTDREVAQREALIKDAEEAIQKRWPGCGLRLVPFGSTRNGLFEARSDIDLTLFDPIRPFGIGTPKDELEMPPIGASHGPLNDSISTYGVAQLPDYYSVNLIRNALQRFGKDDKGKDKFIKVTAIGKARVPITKFVSASSGLSSDINVNDAFGNVNSDLVAAYCEIDRDLVRPFLFAIKKWASRRGINDPAGKSGSCSLNSYTINLIAIQYLQIRQVVPNLQDPELVSQPGVIKTCLWQKPTMAGRNRGLKPIKPVAGAHVDLETGARRFDTTFVGPEQWKAIQDTTGNGTVPMSLLERHLKLGELFKGFFIWLSEFNFDECGISLRLGRPFRKRRLPKSEDILEMPYLEPPSDEWNTDEPIQIQDPFIVDRNTAAAVKSETLRTIIQECRKARRMLEGSIKDQSTLLSELLVDHNHEELVKEHDIVMQSLDVSSVIAQEPPVAKKPFRPRYRNGGNGRGR